MKVFYKLAKSVGARLRKAGQRAGMVSMEIKYYDFRTASHQKQLLKPTNEDQVLYETACQLFKEIWSGEPVRLLGIRTAKLSAESEPEQMTLFDMELPQPPDEKHQRLNAAMEAIRKRYGNDAVKKASLMKKTDGKNDGKKKKNER